MTGHQQSVKFNYAGAHLESEEFRYSRMRILNRLRNKDDMFVVENEFCEAAHEGEDTTRYCLFCLFQVNLEEMHVMCLDESALFHWECSGLFMKLAGQGLIFK